MICSKCNQESGNNTQGHYWQFCSISKKNEDFHFCCPQSCEIYKMPHTSFDTDKTLYKIIRFYFDQSTPSKIIKNNLSLEEAYTHCNDPETSSETAKSEEALEHTEKFGPWFDGYTKQR